jgi:hypothetical protein
MQNKSENWILYETHTVWCVSKYFLSGVVVYWTSTQFEIVEDGQFYKLGIVIPLREQSILTTDND